MDTKPAGDMFPKATTADVTLEDKIKELERELAKRWRLYPKLVKDGKLNQQQADKQTLIIQAVLEDLYRYREKEH